MSLTILSYPGNISSVSSEMLFVINEATKANDPVNYPDYKYILDIYVDAVLVARMRAVPDPVNKFGIFDVAPILRSYAPSYGLNMSANLLDYDIRKAYTCKLGEEYNFISYLASVVDSERYFFRTYAERPFTSSAIIANGVASNMPDTITSHGFVYNVIPYFTNVSGETNLTVTHKNAGGSSIGGYSVDNATHVANTIRQVNIDASADQPAYTLLTGPFSLRINYECSKYPVYYLAWLNPYGAYESQTFGMVSKKSIEIEKKSFEGLPYNINASGVVSYAANNVLYGQKKDYSKLIKTKLSLISHLLSADEYTWLADLFKSPDVYLYTSSGWMPVSISNSNYEYRTYLNSRVTPLQFDVEFTGNYNSQFL